MPQFEHSGLSFYYVEIGTGLPFIFLHGLGGSIEQVIKIYSPLQGVRMITFDQRAHGKTSMGEKTDLGFRTFANDVLALYDHLHLECGIIGGISMGAGVALKFTLSHPDKVIALILSRPAWLDKPMEQKNKAIYKCIKELIEKHGTQAGRDLFLVSDVYKDLHKTSPENARSFLVHFEYEHAAATAAKYQLLPEDTPSYDRDEWKKIKVPTLVLASHSDHVHPYEYGLEYASLIGRAELKEITPKTVNEMQHNKDVQQNIDAFIGSVLNKTENVTKQYSKTF
jgi:pimeloyl-ACP methyl ester carboxylesterase